MPKPLPEPAQPLTASQASILRALALMPARPSNTLRRPPWVIQYHVYKALFRRELIDRVGDTLWTFAAAIFEVAMPALIFYLVYVVLGRSSVMGIPIPLFIITGIFTWFTLRKIVQRTSQALRSNIPLMSYRPVQPLDPIIIRTVIETLLFLGAMVCLVVVLAYAGFDASMHNPVWVAALYIIVPLFAFGLGLLLLQLSTFLPWTQPVIITGFRLLMFVSCVVFSLHEVPSLARPLLLLNPIVHIMELIRSSWFGYYPEPEGLSLTYVLLSTIVLLYFGLALFRHNQRVLLQRTLQTMQAS
jgi:capsular polysaccharide transport system permease protein